MLDSDVVLFLERLPTQQRSALWRRLREIADSPDSFEDFVEADDSGRELTGHLFGGFAIVFWDDFADRHLSTSATDLAATTRPAARSGRGMARVRLRRR